MPNHYAVFGDPIAHSLSPEIYALFAAQLGVELPCVRRRVAAGTLEQALIQFFSVEKGSGVCLTLPLKEEGFLWLQQHGHLTPRAQLAQAVNIIVAPAGHWLGDNTDGVGLLRDLTQNQHILLRAQRILLLGAGGAAHSVLPTLVQAEPKLIAIANRNPVRATQLIEDHVLKESAQNLSVTLAACDLSVLGSQQFDLIIDATAASAQGDSLPWPAKLLGTPIYYAMMYGAKAQQSLRHAEQAGAVQSIDGLGMLVEQAAENANLYFLQNTTEQHVYKQLNTQAVIAQLREMNRE